MLLIEKVEITERYREIERHLIILNRLESTAWLLIAEDEYKKAEDAIKQIIIQTEVLSKC